MAYWIFKCNPENYRLEERLADPNPMLTWSVTRYRTEIQIGDTVFLWVTGPKRGIRAVLKVELPPTQMVELESEQSWWVERDTKVEYRVICSLIHRDVNLSSEALKKFDELADLSVFTGYKQGTNYSVTPEQGRLLSQLIAGTP